MSGVASTALYSLITSSGAKARVLGTSSHAVWLDAGDRVLVVTTSDATRLPNGIQLAAGSTESLFDSIVHDGDAEIGFGRVMFEGLSVAVGRWWDPRPVLAPITEAELASTIEGLPNDVPDIDSGPLAAALRARSAGGVLHSARALLGKGPGLTPEGDDFIAGALAATRLLAEAMRRERTIAMVAGISVPLARLAEVRTTAFSASLIQSALRGQVAEPAGSLLRAMTGRGDVAAAHLGLIRVGHTSGPALAAGMVLGAQSLIPAGGETR
ncbi:MAG: DUF2877 domain-containing protein [bacterium]|nr:DUF2877 domain-containing protein [bacterium]